MTRPTQLGRVPGDWLRPSVLCRGVRFLFTHRSCGVSSDPFGTLNLSYSVGDAQSAVSSNRAFVLKALGTGPERLAWMRQVHGADVAYAPGGPGGPAGPGEPGGLAGPGGPASPGGLTDPAGLAADQSPQADAIFTDSPAVAVAALVADCAPVLVADPAAGLVGAAHAGRPGMAAGVVPALVAAMSAAGADPERMHAVIGPAICGQCYEVPAQMRDQVAEAAPGSACVTRKGSPGIDLRAGLHAQLASHGVGNVADDPRCTAESDELFSYRRDGRTGRFAGLIWLTAG